MCPQLLSKVAPNAKTRFGVGSLMARPKLAPYVAEVIHVWSHCDAEYCCMLTNMMQADFLMLASPKIVSKFDLTMPGVLSGQMDYHKSRFAEWVKEKESAYINSADVPGLHLSGSDFLSMKPTLETAIKTLYRDNKNVEVEIVWIADADVFPSHALPSKLAVYQPSAA